MAKLLLVGNRPPFKNQKQKAFRVVSSVPLLVKIVSKQKLFLCFLLSATPPHFILTGFPRPHPKLAIVTLTAEENLLKIEPFNPFRESFNFVQRAPKIGGTFWSQENLPKFKLFSQFFIYWRRAEARLGPQSRRRFFEFELVPTNEIV